MPNTRTLVAALVVALPLLTAAVPASRQKKQVEPLGPVLALARLCVNESGLRAYTRDDCAAVHATIQARRRVVPAYRGLSYLEALHRYSNGVTLERGRRGRPWIVDLWEGARRPAGYPRRSLWEGRGASWWTRTLAHAREVLRGRVVTECYGEDAEGAPLLLEPHTWGRDDIAPPAPAMPLDCGHTPGNTFWSVDEYRRRELRRRDTGAVK